MKLIDNTGTNRVIDVLRQVTQSGATWGIATPALSLFAFAEIRKLLSHVAHSRLILSLNADGDLTFLGAAFDRESRNRLQTRWLARECANWIREKTEVRFSSSPLPQSAYFIRHSDMARSRVIAGHCPLTTDGLGLTPGNRFSLIQCAETPEEVALFAAWYESLWHAMPVAADAKERLLKQLWEISEHSPACLVYYRMLFEPFKARGDELDEARIVKSATGIKDSIVWKKLFRFQRDGVVGAIEKLERLGGCIIADSVGLGKTFEALAIIKYHELRNDRVLVLAPKRLQDNWTLYRANDRRNILAADRFNYDVLNHTDLSRDSGMSGDCDLSHVNWGNYDLVVIDESHNFRNKTTRLDRESRYDRLMRRIIKEGVKTRVLMLSATPVNNRLADIRNQIAFITEGNDAALADSGIASIDATTRLAQQQFNRWMRLNEGERASGVLVDMLGFDYFQLLDLLTIARSRKHIEKYYGTSETGRFPERLKPINIKPDVDRAGEFRSIREINNEIRRLNLAVAPLRYVFSHKQAVYDEKYGTAIRGGRGFFRQVDREESLVHLLRVNVLKRMESAVSAFALTVGRQMADVEATLARIESSEETIEELDIADVDIDDPAFETLLVGSKVKVLIQDMDLVRWKQDLIEDRNRLATLYAAARQVDAARDAKLDALRRVIDDKCRTPSIPATGRSSFLPLLPIPRSIFTNKSPPGRWISSAFTAHSSPARDRTGQRSPA